MESQFVLFKEIHVVLLNCRGVSPRWQEGWRVRELSGGVMYASLAKGSNLVVLSYNKTVQYALLSLN